MKLKGDKKTTTLTMGDVDAKEFGIDTSNGVIFDILRNKMYSNKIAAVAREITSNSRDANRENKKATVPVEVHIVEPNVIISSTDMQIVFKDNGTGITPDRMANIFLNYGASTKRNTNKQTGGFGLGAKTPFAYTDTFTVITVYDGEKGRTKDTYTASITDRKGVGSGEMILFSSEETKEETGTCIVVPIREADRDEFENEVRRATAFWTVKPILKNFRTDEWKFKVVYKGEGNSFNVIQDEDERFVNRYLLVIDGIPYEVDRGVLGLSGDFLNGTDLILCYHYQNGDLTISANREAVQYDRKTKVKMAWKIRQVKNAFCKEIQTLVDKCESYLDTCILANQMSGEVIEDDSKSALWRNVFRYMMPKSYKPTFKGKAVVQQPNFKWHDLSQYTNFDSNNKLTGIRMNVRKFDSLWKTPMYWMDAAKRDSRKNATLIDQGGFILITSNLIELKQGKDAAQQAEFDKAYKKMVDDQAEERKAIEALIPNIGLYSAVIQKVLPKGTSVSYYKKTNDVGVQVRRIKTNWNYSDWESETITFLRQEKTTLSGKQYVYCVTDKLSHFSSYSGNSPKLPSKEELAKGSIASKILKLDFVVVPEASAQYFSDALMLTIDEAWAKALLDPTLEARVVEALNYTIINNLGLSDRYQGLNLTGRVSPDTEAALKLLFNKKAAQRANDFIDNDDVKRVGDFKPTLTVTGVEKELRELKKKYPLMGIFLDSYRYDSYAKEMNQVMDAIDAVENMPKIVRKATLKGKLAVRKHSLTFNKRKRS